MCVHRIDEWTVCNDNQKNYVTVLSVKISGYKEKSDFNYRTESHCCKET